MAEQFCDIGGGITLCYERFGSESDPPMVLIMGLGTQMIGWPDELCALLADRGFQVDPLRQPGYRPLLPDNRRPAHPTPADHPQDRPGALHARRHGGRRRRPDARAEPRPGPRGRRLHGRDDRPDPCGPTPERHEIPGLDHVQHRQPLAGPACLRDLRYLLRKAPDDREGYIEYTTKVFEAIGSRGLPFDKDRVRDMVARSYDRGHDPSGPGRQLGAIIASGDRTAELQPSAPPPWSSTAPRTRWWRAPAAWPRPRRFPAPS